MSESASDPRLVKDGICGFVKFGSTGIEWICIEHDHSDDQPTYHHFINRWPNKKGTDTDA